MDRDYLKVEARKLEAALRQLALNEAVRIRADTGSAKEVVADAKILLNFLRGRK